MLQLRTTGVTSGNGNMKHVMFDCSANARPCPCRASPAQLLQSKVPVHNKSLALQAHRGDEVAAFLVATDTQETGAGLLGHAAGCVVAVAACSCVRIPAAASAAAAIDLPDENVHHHHVTNQAIASMPDENVVIKLLHSIGYALHCSCRFAIHRYDRLLLLLLLQALPPLLPQALCRGSCWCTLLRERGRQ
jgi:hypothetical protein